jgi:hypothetical protein
VLLKHSTTSQWLANDAAKYINDFGVEYEVFGKIYLTTSKTQKIFAENKDTKARQMPFDLRVPKMNGESLKDDQNRLIIHNS